MEAKDFQAEPSAAAPEACLGREEECPLCGRDNQCRVAKGHLYKGPCWCHEIIVPSHIVALLANDQIDPACLCRPCLETIARVSRAIDDPQAVLSEVQRLIATVADSYLDPDGQFVFTSAYHLRRGTCCENGCRHCPY